MDVAALVISIISLVATILIAIVEVIQAKSLNDTSIEAEYFDFLYKEIMLKKIPMGRIKMTFNKENRLIGTTEFLEAIKELRKNTVYYQYTDSKFFKELKTILVEIEDYIILSENKIHLGEEQTEFFSEIHNKLSKMYNILLKKQKSRWFKNFRK